MTFRTRDIKPDEQVLSIWDETQRGRSHMLNSEGRPGKAQLAEDLHQSVFHNEADVLEDAILFPEELSIEKSSALYSGKTSTLEDFCGNGPDWG